MTTNDKRGRERSDVGSRKVFSVAELRGVQVPHEDRHLLALLLFLSRHAERRARVVVLHGADDGCRREEGNDER